MRRFLVAAAVALLASGLVGCTQDDLSVTASEELQAHVDSLHESVAAGDAEGAHLKLAELRAALAEYEEQGDVSPERAAGIREAADEVAEMLALLPADEDEHLAEDEDPIDEEDRAATEEPSGGGSGGGGSGGGGNSGGGNNGGGPDHTPPGHGGEPPGQNRGGGGR